MPLLDVSASYGDCRVTLNIVNLDADHAHDISVRVLGGRWAMIRGFVLTDSNANLDATNDFEHPETVAMHPYGLLPGVGSDGTGQGGDVIRVPPASLTVLELAPTPSTQGEHQ